MELCLDYTQEDPASPNEHSSEEDMDSFCAEYDLKDPAEDSDSESGSSSDNISDWHLLYRPHLGSHGNQPLKAQLSDTEIVSPQDRGEKTREAGKGRMDHLCLFVLKLNIYMYGQRYTVVTAPGHMQDVSHLIGIHWVWT